jgi:hypothetical protein
MPRVHAPDGKVINFPDTMQPPDIEAAMGKLYPSPSQPPGIKPPVVNMQEQPVSKVPLEAEKALNRYTSNLNVENPLHALDTGANYLSTKLSNIPGNPLHMTDYGTQFQRDVNVNPLEFPKQIGQEVSNGEYGNAAGDVASLVTPFAGEAPRGLQLAKDAAESPVGRAVVGGVKGATREAFKPTTYGMHKLPVVAPVAGAMAGHFALSPFGPTASKIGAVGGALMPLVKGAYEGAKEGFNEGKPTIPTPSQFEPSAVTASRMKFGGPTEPTTNPNGFAPIPRKGPGPLPTPAEQPAPYAPNPAIAAKTKFGGPTEPTTSQTGFPQQPRKGPAPLEPTAEAPKEPFKPSPITAQRMKYGGPSQSGSGQGFGKPTRQGTNRAMQPKPEVEESETTTPEQEEPPPSDTQPSNARAEKLANISQALDRKGRGMAHYFDKQGLTPEKVQNMDLLEYERHLKPAFSHAEANSLPRGNRYNSPGSGGFAAEKEATVEALKEIQKNKKK